MDRAAIAVAKNLDFDMTRSGEILFEVKRVVAESRFCFGAGRRQCRRQFGFSGHHTHAAAAAAGRRF